MHRDLKSWRERGDHLPTFMRDFHDQKDLFKTIDEQCVEPNRERMPDWITAHRYTIDAFLWFMARHGYTLQRSRARLQFDGIGDTLQAARECRQEHSASILRSALSKGAPNV